jgi:hypothetical protein
MKPTLALDFDGVLHQYTGFRGDTIIDGGPVPGAVEFVQAAQENFDVVIHSVRAKTRFGRRAMQAWLKENGFPYLEIAAEKPPAHVTLDDRALCFTGTFPDPDALLQFRPWWKQLEAV